MKREIKFRFWNTVANGMVQWDIVRDVKVKELFEVGHLIPMQYTGMCDITGTMIFEGDIVKSSREGYSDAREVIYNYDDCCFQIGHLANFNKEDSYTIIGNIYKNPELLK